MNLRIFGTTSLATVIALSSISSPHANAQTGGFGGTIDGVRDTGQYVPNDAVLARVADKEITAGQFIDRYFNSLIEFRPSGDLAGRTEFLESMITKEVLALTAIEANRPLDFEDRLLMRQHEQRLLSNVLYQRLVLDSVSISEDDVQRVYGHYRENIRLQHILFPNREAAVAARPEIVEKRISWQDAVAKYSLAADGTPDGDLGWQNRIGADAILAEALWPLAVGEVSQPVADGAGIHLMRCVERRPYDAPALESLRSHIRNDIRRLQTTRLSDRLMRSIAKDVAMTYDSALVRTTAQRFAQPSTRMTAGGITVDPNMPQFDPADTARVLARWRDGTLSVGRFVHAYEELSPIARPPINTFDSVIGQIHAITLEPYRIEMAQKMELDKDPMTVQYLATRLEQLRVERMFEDSISAKLWISKEQRQAYYTANAHGFMTYPTVRFARFHAARRSLADSVLARLAAGDDPATLASWDAFEEHSRAQIEERSQNEPGGDSKLLFEELLPGESRLQGPDSHEHYTVYHLIEATPSYQLPLAEVEDIVDESLRNIESEKLLKELVARHRDRYHVESHPELLMRVRLVDPYLSN